MAHRLSCCSSSKTDCGKPLKSAQCELGKDIEVGVYVRDLKQMWSALSDIHSVVKSHPVQLVEVDKAIAKLRLALGTFEFEAAPKPCACIWKRRFHGMPS
jgi:hypothetical protein